MFSVFQKQNAKISRGEISGPGTHYLHLDTLGIINGCIEDQVQDPAYSFMAWNNTYGVQAVNETTKHRQLWELYRPGGIEEQLAECARLAKALEDGLDPDEDDSQAGRMLDRPDPAYVEQYCLNASIFSADVLVTPYMESQRYGFYDVTHPAGDPFPSNYHLGWLTQHWVQKALGVPVNFTWASSAVNRAFTRSGDMPRGGYLEDLAHLLDNGVKVHLMFGDRDYACSW